jgi:hypothetical protein
LIKKLELEKFRLTDDVEVQKQFNSMLEDSIKEISRQIPDLHSQIFNAKKELDLSRRQIDIMKIEHLS